MAMALRPVAPLQARSAWERLVCAQCRRSLSTSPPTASGHNRWSKIRHEKGAADMKKTALRSGFTKTIAIYSSNPLLNPQLASVIATAKKAGVPKALIEGAIARGQGKSASGASLEQTTFEIMMPPSVALIVDVETESKARALQDLNAMIRRRHGTLKSTKFFFARRGRVVLGEKEADGELADATQATLAKEPATADDVLDDVIEAGAEDVETDDNGHIVVWTPPNQTAGVVNAITGTRPDGTPASAFGDRLSVVSAETVWSANEETRSPLNDDAEELRRLSDMIAALRAYQDVRAIYCNASQGSAPDDKWDQIVSELDW